VTVAKLLLRAEDSNPYCMLFVADMLRLFKKGTKADLKITALLFPASKKGHMHDVAVKLLLETGKANPDMEDEAPLICAVERECGNCTAFTC
jgi:hypothetical protein